MTCKWLGALVTAVLTVALDLIVGCGSRRDWTYIPFDENHGEPTLGKQAEGIPNGMGEELERLDRRVEAWLY
jgi:hypothetical protein